jgi:hypothetical protein
MIIRQKIFPINFLYSTALNFSKLVFNYLIITTQLGLVTLILIFYLYMTGTGMKKNDYEFPDEFF